jgi:exopolyphosphatase/pppGpp-phosphohydrolase
MDNLLRRRIESFAKGHCLKAEDGVDLWEVHVQLVRRFALELTRLEHVDADVLEIAALLHDIGRDGGGRHHSERSYELSKQFLAGVDIDERKKKLILECIRYHSSRFAGGEYETEVQVMQCADALAVLFDDVWQERSMELLPKEELLKLYDKALKKLTLASARGIAKPQLERLKRLLD